MSEQAPEPEAPPDIPPPPSEDSDKATAIAGEKEHIPVNAQGDQTPETRPQSRQSVKDLAGKIRERQEAQDKEASEAREEEKKRAEQMDEEQRKVAKERERAAKEQKKAAEAQRGTAEQNELVQAKQGAFGEVTGTMPRYQAEQNNYKIKPIKSNRFKQWIANN